MGVGTVGEERWVHCWAESGAVGAVGKCGIVWVKWSGRARVVVGSGLSFAEEARLRVLLRAVWKAGWAICSVDGGAQLVGQRVAWSAFVHVVQVRLVPPVGRAERCSGR